MGTTSQIPSVARPIIRTGALNPLLSNRSKVVIILVTIPVTNLTTRNFIRILLGSSGSKPRSALITKPVFVFVFLFRDLIWLALNPIRLPAFFSFCFPQNWWHLARSPFCTYFNNPLGLVLVTLPPVSGELVFSLPFGVFIFYFLKRRKEKKIQWALKRFSITEFEKNF